MSESLDDVLHIATDATKKKSAKKVAPASSKSKEISRGLFDVDDTGADGTADDMGTDDIMKYIQQNQAADDDDLELF